MSCDQNSSHVKDTVDHNLSPFFSVDNKLLCSIPGHAGSLEILTYGVGWVLSHSSWLLLCQFDPNIHLVLVVCLATWYALCKPAYSEQVSKPRTRDGCGRKNIQHKNTFGCILWQCVNLWHPVGPMFMDHFPIICLLAWLGLLSLSRLLWPASSHRERLEWARLPAITVTKGLVKSRIRWA